MQSHTLTHIWALLFLFSAVTLAATPTSFCKCICFGDYKIIPLDAPTTSNDNIPQALFRSRADGDESKEDGTDGSPSQEYHHKTCNDCNKVFCLEQNLPECKDATDQDVSATCFQRDSSKDEAVVFIFIFATLGLLSWAILRPWVDRWTEKYRERNQYMPVAGDGR